MSGHGGRRAGAGRKKMNPPVRPTYVSLTDAQVKLLRMWGRGDVSAGLRWLIEMAAPLIRKVDSPHSSG